MFGFPMSQAVQTMWWKVIIVGLTGKKPTYKLFSSEDTPETRIEPIQKQNYKKAFHAAQGFARQYQDRYHLIEWPRIMVFQIPQPAVPKKSDLRKAVEDFLSDYMNMGFIKLIQSFYWQKAIESSVEMDKKLQLGFSVFKAMVEKDVPEWKEFYNQLSAKADEVDIALRSCFESHYMWYWESHQPSAVKLFGEESAQAG